MRVHRLCLLGLLTLLAASAYAQSAGTHAGWLKHREALRGNADVLGYYTFEDVTQAAPTTKNLRPADHPLSFALVPAADVAPQKLELVPGRWPEKQAVRLDMGRLEGAPFEVTSKSFSASCWVRKLGPGIHRGNSGATNGTILSTGIGYWDGWRLTTSYPQMSLGFEIGRPQPQSSFGINAGPAPDNVWQHLCVTWDGRETRLYANGLLIAKGSYAGDYTPPPGDKRFRIGFASRFVPYGTLIIRHLQRGSMALLGSKRNTRFRVHLRAIEILPVLLFCHPDVIDENGLLFARHLIVSLEKGGTRLLLIGHIGIGFVYIKHVVDER